MREGRLVHDALTAAFGPDEVVVGWVMVVEVAGPNGVRYLAHRAGGGHDGLEPPTAWTVLGMLESGVDSARDQLREMTVDVHDDDEHEEGRDV